MEISVFAGPPVARGPSPSPLDGASGDAFAAALPKTAQERTPASEPDSRADEPVPDRAPDAPREADQPVDRDAPPHDDAAQEHSAGADAEDSAADRVADDTAVAEQGAAAAAIVSAPLRDAPAPQGTTEAQVSAPRPAGGAGGAPAADPMGAGGEAAQTATPETAGMDGGDPLPAALAAASKPKGHMGAARDAKPSEAAASAPAPRSLASATASPAALASPSASTGQSHLPPLEPASGLGGEAVNTADPLLGEGDGLGATALNGRGASAAVDALRLGAGPRLEAAGIAALATRIAQRTAEGATRFEVRLDPPELGRVDVKLEVDRSGKAQALLLVERPETLSELSRQARQLERALAEAGVDVDADGLTFGLSDDAAPEGDTEADHDPAGDGPPGSSSHGAKDTNAGAAGDSIALAPTTQLHGFTVLTSPRWDVRA